MWNPIDNGFFKKTNIDIEEGVMAGKFNKNTQQKSTRTLEHTGFDCFGSNFSQRTREWNSPSGSIQAHSFRA
jgi:hypothetical protein